MVDRKVLRSVRAVKARAVTGEARRKVGDGGVVCNAAVCDDTGG